MSHIAFYFSLQMAATGMAPEELGDICLTLHPEPVKQSHPQYLKPGIEVLRT